MANVCGEREKSSRGNDSNVFCLKEEKRASLPGALHSPWPLHELGHVGTAQSCPPHPTSASRVVLSPKALALPPLATSYVSCMTSINQVCKSNDNNKKRFRWRVPDRRMKEGADGDGCLTACAFVIP